MRLIEFRPLEGPKMQNSRSLQFSQVFAQILETRVRRPWNNNSGPQRIILQTMQHFLIFFLEGLTITFYGTFTGVSNASMSIEWNRYGLWNVIFCLWKFRPSGKSDVFCMDFGKGLVFKADLGIRKITFMNPQLFHSIDISMFETPAKVR